jgi:predicted nucleic acid-binding protein
VILLDAAPLIAFLTGDAGGSETHSLITGREPVAVTVVNLAEVFDVLNRTPSADAGRRAGALRARHYRRRSCELSLADCFLLAAVGPEDRVATSDTTVLRVAGLEGLGVVPVPPA